MSDGVAITIGVTGTRYGATDAQLRYVRDLLCSVKGRGSVMHLRHGDCLGADVQVFRIAYSLEYVTHSHPCDLERWRAHTPSTHIYTPTSPISRNEMIVDLSDMLVALPHTNREVMRSGTWATVRYARKLGRVIYIVWPDGTVTKEGL